MLQDPMPPCTWIYASLEADTKLSSGMQLWWKYPNQPEEMFCLCAVRAGYGEAAVIPCNHDLKIKKNDGKAYNVIHFACST